MTVNGWLQIALYCVLLVLLTKPLGGYMTAVFNGERTFLSPVLRPLERGLVIAQRRQRTRRRAGAQCRHDRQQRKVEVGF